MDVQRLEFEIEHEADSGLMAPKTLVDDGGWLCGTSLGAAAIARNLRKLYYPWSKPHGQEDHSITDTT